MRKTLLYLLYVAASCSLAIAQSATIVAQVSVANMASGIPQTVLVAPSTSSALYRVTYYFNIDKVDGLNSQWCFGLHWGDEVAPRLASVEISSTQSFGLPPLISGVFVAHVKAGSSLEYTVSQCGMRKDPYDLYATVEQLQ